MKATGKAKWSSSLVSNGSGGVSSKKTSDFRYDPKSGKMVRTTTAKVGGGGRRGAAPKKPTAQSTKAGVAAAIKKGDVKLAAARVKNAAPSLIKQGKSAAKSKFSSAGGNTKLLRAKTAAKKAAGVASAAGRSAGAIASNKFKSARKSLNSAAKSGFAMAGGNTKLLRAKTAANSLMTRAKNSSLGKSLQNTGKSLQNTAASLAFKFTPARAAALRKAQKVSAMNRRRSIRSGRGGM